MKYRFDEPSPISSDVYEPIRLAEVIFFRSPFAESWIRNSSADTRDVAALWPETAVTSTLLVITD